MDTNGANVSSDAEMTNGDGEKVVTMMDVLQEQQDFEDDANAVLGASDEKNCTYPMGYVKRQAIYACLTCCPDAKFEETKRAGVCLACSLTCHENHDLIELYTKRNFRCDCGNPKFNSTCQFTADKTDLNEENKYNQNFSGVYCVCHRPYPDPEAEEEDEMIQCIICEDWLHSAHLEAMVPAVEQYAEMICKQCINKNEFLHDYVDYAVNTDNLDPEPSIVNVTTISNDLDVLNKTNNADTADGSKSAAIEMTDNDKTNTEEINENLLPTDEQNNGKSDEDMKQPDGDIMNTTGDEQINNPSDTVCNDDKPSKNDIDSGSQPKLDDDKPSKNDIDSSSQPKLDDDKPSKNDIDSSSQPKLDDDDIMNSASDEQMNDDPDTVSNNDKASKNDVDSSFKPNDNLETSEPQDSSLNENIDTETKSNENVTQKEPPSIKSDESNCDATISMDEKEISINVNDNSEKEGKITDEEPLGNTENIEPITENSENTNDILINGNHDGHSESKRKLDDSENDTVSKKLKLEEPNDNNGCLRPKKRNKSFKGASFWPSNFRQKLCTCNECISMYKDLSVLYLTDLEDTVSAYETLGQEKTNGTAATQYEKGLEALSSLDRVQQINALTEYNNMRDKLLDFLKSFKDKKEIVKEDDIKAFFAGMKAKREPDGVYFCR